MLCTPSIQVGADREPCNKDDDPRSASAVFPLATKCDNPLLGWFDVELDMEAIAGEVFGLLIEKFKDTI